mmetsp:Transcript_2763/g.8710  ORF Transcript_2763/g.8710 Transcript_2763/m.8710 type:complete len:262 (-) Transcript_2763:134-919(-)
MGFSEKYFSLVNGALMLAGLAVLGYAGYLLAEYDDLVQGVGTFTVMVPLVVGGSLVAVGLIGCLGAKKNIKLLLIIYFLLASAALLVVLAMGSALLAIGGYLEDVEKGEAIENDIMGTITDFQIALFNGCCGPQPGVTPVTTLCDENITSNCISNVDVVEDFQEAFGEETCEYLADVEIDGAPIVGNVTADPTSCGGGDIDAFISAITAYIEDNIYVFGGVNIGLAVLMLLLVISSCCLIFKKKEDANKKKQQVEANQLVA